MRKIETTKDVTKIFENMTAKVLDDVLRKTANVQVVTIESIDTDTRKAFVRVVATGSRIANVRVARSVTSAYDGDVGLIISPDGKLRSQRYLIAVFGA